MSPDLTQLSPALGEESVLRVIFQCLLGNGHDANSVVGGTYVHPIPAYISPGYGIFLEQGFRLTT
jgi:hypothetical protein